MDAVEFLVAKANGVPLEQKNFMLCAANDGIFVDIHLSKVKFRPEEETLFTDVLKQVRFVDVQASAPSTAGPTSLDYFREGSKLYIMQDYTDAIGPYQKALDLETQNPQIPKTDWFVLVDNLGMAYGMTGDLNHAEKVFDYGVSREPRYPLFYYNLACTYAERKKMDRTMNFLKTAFDLKANVLPGESMPDPRKDDSFQEFMKDKKFRDFVDSLLKTN